MDRLNELQQTLLCKLSETKNVDERKLAVFRYLERVEGNSVLPMSSLLRPDQDWLNTECSLSWEKHLHSRVLVLDFFTYCCVNCLHVLPILKQLEEEFPPEKGLVVLGVHSAKFINERSTANVANAILQNHITHCVVNDPKAELWNQLQICCWPTLFIIGPKGEALFCLMGEGHREELFLFCQLALEYFHPNLKPRPLPIHLLRNKSSNNYLRYPGKVVSGLRNRDIVLSDTGNNRIIILTSEGVVKETIGGPDAGFKNGSFLSCSFNRPQGLAVFRNDWIYVADTENHAIRLIDLRERCVTTVVGTGQQGFDHEGGAMGTKQPISTPWDLCIAPAFGSPVSTTGEVIDDSVLYIAMAGLHQIWAYFLQDTCWPKCSKPIKTGTCFSAAGNGKEENRNNSYPQRSGFAQPSGLAYSNHLRCLFVADSESSSIRSISLSDGSVKGLVGGTRDPLDLFAFGDKDGFALDVRLQHPLGITWCEKGKLLYITDTYNHKLKAVDPIKKHCQHVVLDCDLHEPGGICSYGDEHLLVADTQAHTLLKVTLKESKCHCTKVPIVETPIDGESYVDGPTLVEPTTAMQQFVQVLPGGFLTISLKTVIQDNFSLSTEAPQSWSLKISNSDSVKCVGPSKGQMNLEGDSTKIVLTFPENNKITSTVVLLYARCYICDKLQNVCLSRDCEWAFNITIQDTSPPEQHLELLWHINN